MRLSEEDQNRIGDAFESIEQSLSVLVEKQSLSREEYRADRTSRDVVERRFVKATEAALDIASVLVVAETGDHPESHPEAMTRLVRIGVLTDETGEQMPQAARFRNVLAHTYGDVIDHDRVYDALQDLDRSRTFLVEVREYLTDSGVVS